MAECTPVAFRTDIDISGSEVQGKLTGHRSTHWNWSTHCTGSTQGGLTGLGLYFGLNELEWAMDSDTTVLYQG